MYDAQGQQPDLLLALRRGTAPAHEKLEASLDLLSQVGDRQAFLRVLELFYGFHVVWERAIRKRPDFQAFHRPRSRLSHLRRDLAALGRPSDEIDDLPLCMDAAGLAADAASALGSVYVVEGSTLGGQVIGRALANADWLPAGGLTYFHPYGARTGEMWRDFRAWAQAHPAAETPDAVTAGANRTFELLTRWLR